MSIAFRPHHFLCALCFQGRGYSPAFVANFQALMDAIHASEDTIELQIVNHTDAICHPCPHRIEKICSTEEKIQALDAAHAKALGITAGETITWHDAKKRMAEKLNLETFHRICASCSWKSLGICENVLMSFLAENQS